MFVLNSFVNSQSKISLNAGYGYYLNNSENSMKIMSDKMFDSYFLFGFIYQNENIFGYNLMVDYSYHQITKEEIFNITYYLPDGDSEPIFFVGDMTHISHNIDIDYIVNISKYFSYGIGASFVIVNRILETTKIEKEESSSLLYDKLASSGLGINGQIEFKIPLTTDENYFYFSSLLRLRYTHSIWFDDGIRNLNDYFQEYLTAHLSVGVGYTFK